MTDVHIEWSAGTNPMHLNLLDKLISIHWIALRMHISAFKRSIPCSLVLFHLLSFSPPLSLRRELLGCWDKCQAHSELVFNSTRLLLKEQAIRGA